MAIIYEVLNNEIVPFFVFDKYDTIEKINKIYSELDAEYPKRFILNIDGKEN